MGIFCCGESYFNRDAAQWILLDNITSPVIGPSSILTLDTPANYEIDRLIEAGESEFFGYLTSNPKAIDSLNGKQFESLVVSIYRNLGFDTEPVGRWNQADGGVDIIAVSKTEASIDFRLAIQCKASKNMISAKPLRELAGVLDNFKVNKGLVVTTSKFTGPARREAEGHLWRIELQDRDDVIRKLLKIMRPNLRSFIEDFESQ